MIFFATFFFCVFLLLASAFFSASETALVSLSAQKAKRLAVRSPHLAADLAGWLRKPHELLTTILIGNTLVNVMFASVLTIAAVHMFHQFPPGRVEFVAWLLETICLLMFAEMGPKFIARATPEKMSLFTLPWLSRLRNLLSPLLRLVSAIVGFLFPGMSPPVAPILTFSLDELKGLLDEGTAGVTEESIGMMKRVLEINARRAADIMVPADRVDIIEIDPPGRSQKNRELIMDLVVEQGHTRTPIIKKGEIVGFLHSSDLLPLLLSDRGEDLTTLVRSALNVASDRLVGDLLQDFRTSGVHLGFVRDAAGTFMGLVTLEDVLEEITGEILDEYDVTRPPAGAP